MAFGKKKTPITNKLTQTHRISADGVLDIQPGGRIAIEVEDLGSVLLDCLLLDLDGYTVSISVSTKREDYLELGLSEDDDLEDE